MTRLIWTVLFCLTLILSPMTALAEDGIAVRDSSAQVFFPQSLTFNLEVESGAPIASARLSITARATSCAQATRIAQPDFAPAPRVRTSWTLDMRKSGGLPPGTELEYFWLIEDAAGNKLSTAPQVVKFEDDRRQWHSLTSGKLTLLWYQGNESFAQELLSSALEASDRLAQDTGARLNQTVRIYIYASSDDLRGATVYSQEWIGGQAYPEYGIIALGIEPERLSWGKEAIAHELAHLMVYQITFNCYGDLPTWLDEGLAMYAMGGLGSQYRSALEKAITADALFSVRTLSSSFPASGDAALLSYAQSYSLVDSLIREYGKDKMLQLLDAFRGGSTYDAALIKVYGFDQDLLGAEWRESLGLPAEAKLPSAPTQLIPTPAPSGALACQSRAATTQTGFNPWAIAFWGTLILVPAAITLRRRIR